MKVRTLAINLTMAAMLCVTNAMASVIPIAIFTNAARVTVTGIMAHYRGEEAAQGFQHAFSGWLMFIVAMLLLLVIAQALRLISKLLPAKLR